MVEGNYLPLKGKETNGEIASYCATTCFHTVEMINFPLTFTGAKLHFSAELCVLGPCPPVLHAWGSDVSCWDSSSAWKQPGLGLLLAQCEAARLG